MLELLNMKNYKKGFVIPLILGMIGLSLILTSVYYLKKADSQSFRKTVSTNEYDLYQGRVVFSGNYIEYGSDGMMPKKLCFEPDFDSGSQVPRPNGNVRQVWFCFDNQEEAKKMLEIDESVFNKSVSEISGKAVILVTDYKLQTQETDTPDTAKIEKVVTNFGSSSDHSDEMKDWQVYSNDKYGFEFKYPSEWKQIEIERRTSNEQLMFIKSSDEESFKKNNSSLAVQEGGAYSVIIQGKIFTVTIKKPEEIDAFLNMYKNMEGIYFSEIDIGNNTVTKMFSSDQYGGGSTETYLFKNKNFAVFMSASYLDVIPLGELKPIFNNVISSFKIISDHQPTDWETYSNAGFGFEIKIPSDWKIVKDFTYINEESFCTTIQSPDYIPVNKDFGELGIVVNDVQKGAELKIYFHKFSNIKTIPQMIEFWKEGRGGHFIKDEKVIELEKGIQALRHSLKDYPNSNLEDLHFINGDVWIDVNYASQKNYSYTFDQIISALKISDSSGSDNRILLNPETEFGYTGCDIKCVDKNTLNYYKPSTEVLYSNKEKGIEFKIPFNPKWGDITYKLNLFDEFNGFYVEGGERKKEEGIEFGPLVSTGTGYNAGRSDFLYFVQPRSAEIVKQEIDKNVDNQIKNGFATEDYRKNVDSKIITLGGVKAVEHFESSAEEPNDRIYIEVVGGKYNYQFMVRQPYGFRDKEYLESIVKTVKILD